MITFHNFYTIENRNECSIKHAWSVSLQPYHVSTLPGKTNNSTKMDTASAMTAVRSVELTVPNFRRKSFSVRFFPCLLENSFSSLLAESILCFREFYQKVILKINIVNFSIWTRSKVSNYNCRFFTVCELFLLSRPSSRVASYWSWCMPAHGGYCRPGHLRHTLRLLPAVL